MSAVIFDCDGVLVDSEPIAEAAWTSALTHFGYDVQHGDFEQCIGRSRRDTHRFFSLRHALPDYETFSARVDEEILPRLKGDLEAFPDAVLAVQELAMQGIPLAVASSSQRRDLDLKLQVTNLARYFDCTVAGDEVESAKPAPDVFLLAAEALRIDPHRCIVVEDSRPGVEAAHAAGMRVIMVDRTGAAPSGAASVNQIAASDLLVWLGLR